MYLPDAKQIATVSELLGLPAVNNVMAFNYVCHPEKRKARYTLDILFIDGHPWFTQANWRISLLYFLPDAIYFARNTAGRFNATQLAENTIRIPRECVTNFRLALDPEERFRLTFNYATATGSETFYGLFGGMNDDSDNERAVRYLASNGFYYLTPPFKATNYREFTGYLKEEKATEI